jgi:uncharacterized protein YegJ (DUF2314 family)
MANARAVTAAILALLAACGEGGDDVVKRDGNPNYVRKFDQSRMDRAIAEARSTLGEFVKALQEQQPGTSSFTIKKGFPTPGGSKEYIWITGVRLSGDGFEGTIDNEPVEARNLKVGQVVKVSKADTIDWFYHVKGKLRGGYTIVALVYGTPEQAKYEKELGITWTSYGFLK